ncbi:hypothetical protein M7I_4898 [Glarea lozoyensis 74030]|nr:hypothetical protein M7I_4898 [Glarea lozoyensis 74030]
MDLIYATAALTLVAAAGSDSDHGLSGVGLTARNPLNSVEVSNSLRFVSVKHAEDCIRDTTWATRAWTLQEGLLAKRRLVFTSEQMFFECQEMQVAETVAVPLEVLHESHVTSRLEGGYFHAMANHHILYYRIVWIFRNYTRRSLSYSADRINAFQGILNSMKPTMTHVWGLPISADEDKMGSFIGSLGWEHDKTWFREFRDQVKRSPEFPSWSWAAWEGQQDYSSLNSTKDLRVKFYLTDGSPVDLSNESTKEELRGLESKATHRFTLQTFILNPDSITAHDSKLYLYHEARQNFFEPMKVQHYLGRDEDDKTLEQIRIGVFKLIYVGTVHHAASRIQPQMRFIVGRNKEDSLERIGLMKVKLGTSEDEMAYLRSNANFMSIDLV